MIKNYLKTAWRNIVRQKLTSSINIIGLSVSMASAVMIAWWVQNERSYDNYHNDSDKIFRIANHLKIAPDVTWVWENSPFTYASLAKTQIPEIESYSLFRDGGSNDLAFYISNTAVKDKSVAYVDTNWFEMFNFSKAYGNVVDFGKDPFSVVLTKEKAMKFFGKENAVGEILRIDSLNYSVKAVLNQNPTNSSFQRDIWLPISSLLKNPDFARNAEGWSNFDFVSFVKLTSAQQKGTVETKLTSLLKSQKDKETEIKSTLTNVSDLHFDNTLKASAFDLGSLKNIRIFSIVGILLLLIACINYVNLTTARANVRLKEVSIRKIVGAERGQLFKQFITESFLTASLSLVFSVLFIWLALPWFNTLTNNHFSLTFDNKIVVVILIGILSLISIVNGIYPALFLSSFKPIDSLKGKSVLGLSRLFFRKSLVVVQFVTVVGLISCTLVIFSQMKFIQKTSADYNRSQILKLDIPWSFLGNKKMSERASVMQSFKQDILSESTILRVSKANNDIVNNQQMSSGGFAWKGRTEGHDPFFMKLSADEDYAKMFNLKLVEGQWEKQTVGKKKYYLNETAVKELNLQKPVVGNWFVVSGDTGVIAGVMKDFYYKKMTDAIGPVVMFDSPSWSKSILVEIKEGQNERAIFSIEKLWRSRFIDVPFEYSFLDESFDKLYSKDKQALQLVVVFSIVAIAVSVLGILGLVTFSAERRTKEIGIRKVLGASVFDIVNMLSKEFTVLIVLSIAIATPIAWVLMSKWLNGFAYRVDLSVGFFLFSGLLSLFIAMFTISFQAIKAARANPVKSLRTE